jgi:hypothetical protein
MRSLFGLLVMVLVMVTGGIYAFNRMRQVPLVAPAVPPRKEAKEGAQAVTMVGPLANYMAKEEGAKASADPQAVETVTWVPTASDHVGGSVVGSTIPILRKSFSVRSAVQIAFAVPAHAASPRLRGTFQSSSKRGGDAYAGVEFLVLNEQQYSDFVNRRSGEASFSAEDAPAGEVNAILPPTMNTPAKYHLVFRNNSRSEGKKLVQADFRMEF